MLNVSAEINKSGIARRLIIYVVLFSSFITLLTTATQLYWDYNKDINVIEEQLQQAQDVHLRALTATLWASDTKELKTHLEGISQLRDMQFLEVRDQEKMWVSVGTPQSNNVMSRQYPMIYPHRGRDIKIGTLTVVASLTGVYQRLFDKVWVVLVSNGIKTFLVAGFILVIFHALITRHLIRIADFAHALDINRLDRSLGLDRKDHRKQKVDELDLVVNAINQMQVNIKDSLTALGQSEEHFQTLAKVAPVGIFSTDAQANYIYVNKRWCELAGMSEKEALGEGWVQTLHPEDRERVLMEWRQAAVDSASFHSEYRFQRPDGKVCWLLGSAEVELDAGGQVVGYVGAITDVTERRQTEDALRRSQKMEAIGQLSGGVAHDFNNQLGVIIGYLDFLRNHFPEGEKPRQWVDIATRATLRCMNLTRQLLAFSRRQTKEKTVVDLNATFKDLETMIARSVTPEVEVQYYLCDTLWLTEIDPGEFQDAILNLVINARDAMPGGGTLLIETTNKHLGADYAALNPWIEPGDYVQLMLSDTGIGMDKDTIEHVFEPFFTTKPEGIGTGLGLAMVYGFVKRYGGYIKVYSEPGVGTTIRLYLPRSTASESAIMANNAHEAVVPTGTESILIVDDETDLLALADQHLTDLGYRTYLAETAAQALAILEGDEEIDLLFSDVVMPGDMNGYELALRATKQRPALKVLLTSGFTSKTMANNGLARFSTHLLSKPYRKADLAQRIRRVLDEATAT